MGEAFLIMNEVADQGLATVIQIKSAAGGFAPLVAAAPQWTKRTVLQAVKYGICDILVTPAGSEEIRKKIHLHLRSEEKQTPRSKNVPGRRKGGLSEFRGDLPQGSFF